MCERMQTICLYGRWPRQWTGRQRGRSPEDSDFLFTTKVSVGAGNLKIGKLTNEMTGFFKFVSRRLIVDIWMGMGTCDSNGSRRSNDRSGRSQGRGWRSNGVPQIPGRGSENGDVTVWQVQGRGAHVRGKWVGVCAAAAPGINDVIVDSRGECMLYRSRAREPSAVHWSSAIIQE